MRTSILMILFLLLVPIFAQPRLAKLTAPVYLAISSVGQFNPAAAAPAFNFNQPVVVSSNDQPDFGGVGEFIYSAIYVFNKLAEKQPFWRPDKGLIIPLALGSNPLQVMPSMNYNQDSHKNKYVLKMCLMF